MVNVLSLNNPQKEIAFQSSFLLPAGEMLKNGSRPLSLVAKKERNVLLKIFEEISDGYASQ